MCKVFKLSLNKIYVKAGGLGCGKGMQYEILMFKLAKREVIREYGLFSFIFMKREMRNTLVKHMYIYIKHCFDLGY